MDKPWRQGVATLGMCAALILAGRVFAAGTAVLPVQAVVPPSCRVDVAPLDFGVFTGAPLAAATTVSVVCQAGLPYQVILEGGLGAQGAGPRWASLGTAALPYDLGFAPVGQEAPAAAVAREMNQVGTGAPQTFRLQGRLRPSGRIPPGVYRDVVQVTVQF